MLQPIFKSAKKLEAFADAYFKLCEGEFYFETKAGKDTKVYTREPEPPTLAGLAFQLGFNSRKDFEDFEKDTELGYIIKRSRLKIEAFYEKKLHQQSSTGAIFALKTLGWKDKTDEKINQAGTFTTMKIEVIQTGPTPSGAENEVSL